MQKCLLLFALHFSCGAVLTRVNFSGSQADPCNSPAAKKSGNVKIV